MEGRILLSMNYISVHKDTTPPPDRQPFDGRLERYTLRWLPQHYVSRLTGNPPAKMMITIYEDRSPSISIDDLTESNIAASPP